MLIQFQETYRLHKKYNGGKKVKFIQKELNKNKGKPKNSSFGDEFIYTCKNESNRKWKQ